MNNWLEKNVLAIGAARQGLAITRYLSGLGAHVLLTDQRPEEEFSAIVDEFRGLPVRFHFGSHPIALLEKIDLVCVSGGVPLELPIIREAQKRSIPLTNDTQIFMEAVSASVIGITGSSGKTTTTILVGEIAKAGKKEGQTVWVGGNIGKPLVNDLDSIQALDIVVLEISSFQLELMTISPEIAAVLNITPNHLDRHADMDAYIAAKSRILQFQREEFAAVLNCDNPEVWKFHEIVNGKLFTFSMKPLEMGQIGAFVQNGSLYLTDGNTTQRIMGTEEIVLRGEHNIQNALAACAIAQAAGFSVEAMRAGIAAVKGVPHRLELVRELNRVLWFNDSIATTPERALAAMRSFKEPLILLLGGRDKKLPWELLAEQAHSQAKHVILFGEAANLIENALHSFEKGNPPYPLIQCRTLRDAVKQAADVAKAGDVVLLSPGGTSFDAFRDFEERGEYFRNLVAAL